MFERTPREVTSEAMSFARTAKKPHEITAWLKCETIPYFDGDFARAVDALATDIAEAPREGSKPSVWMQIRAIDEKLPMMGRALSAIAVSKGIDIDPAFDRFPYKPEDYGLKAPQ